MKKHVFSLAAVAVLSLLFYVLSSYKSIAPGQDFSWKKLDDGLFLGEYISPKKSEVGDSKITILKIDPKFYSFHLAEANAGKEARKTASEWCYENGFVAAVNAGMYHPDGRNVGFMKNFKSINNPSYAAAYKSILAFNPKDASLPEVKLIDMACEDHKTLVSQYNSCSQSIRMISCEGKNVWAQQPKKWSMVVWGMDKAGNALMIFSRSPYSVHDFINILKAAPIDIARCMYLEGGPEASFYLKHGSTTRELYGSYETGFYESDANNQYWAIPNVVGIRKK